MAFAGTVASVIVRPAADVAGDQVVLRDIATIQCSDKTIADKLRSANLCPSPLPGKSRSIPKDQIIIAIRKQGISDSKVDLLCPEQIDVTRTASTITGQAMFEAVRDFVTTSVQWPGNVTVEPVRLPTDQLSPAGKVEIKVHQGMQPIRKGRTTIQIDIVVDGQPKISVQVPVIIHVFAPVLVTTQSIAKGEALTISNTAIEECEITSLSDDIQTGSPTIGIVAKIPIGQGTAVRGSWVAVPPAIHSGDNVIVVVCVGAVRISDKGTAISDGRTGEQIKIRLQGNTTREVSGTVVSPGLVEIDQGGRNS